MSGSRILKVIQPYDCALVGSAVYLKLEWVEDAHAHELRDHSRRDGWVPLTTHFKDCRRRRRRTCPVGPPARQGGRVKWERCPALPQFAGDGG